MDATVESLVGMQDSLPGMGLVPAPERTKFSALVTRVAGAAAPWLFLILVQALAPRQLVRAEPLSPCIADGSPLGSDATDATPQCSDVDRDGLHDALEQAMGTKPLRRDTDEDGVPDGVEDRNRDGVVGPGETDPRVPGLFPGTYPHIPEPMVFDLVRALGARRGEVEVNTLATLAWERQHAELAWAPEVEWALLDGIALELELPIHGRELEALKGAFQLTLPTSRTHLTHGVQVISEYFLDQRETEATVLYIFGARAGLWSMLMLAGPRARTPMGARADWSMLLNPSLYREVNEWLTCGIEGNLALGLAGDARFAIVPQVHWQFTRAVRLQIGGGARVARGRGEPLLIARIVLES